MALAVATGVLIIMLFTVSTRMMYQGGKIKQLDWDVATVTAGDYSVEFPIEADKYEAWKQNVYRAPNGPFEQGEAPALALKETMAQEIEKQLDDFVNNNEWVQKEVYGKDFQTKTYGGTKVADIVFSFNNSRLIKALRARGGSIASQDFDDMREQEGKISELFQDFNALTVPTSAFITFESDDSANAAKEIRESDSKTMKLIGQDMKFKTVSEPTDIIWENRHFTRRDYFFRQLWAFIIIAVLMFGSLIVIYVISAYSADLAKVFPPVDCANLKTAYGNNEETLQRYAIDDYNFVEANPGQPSSGCLQCYCQDLYKEDKDAALTISFPESDNQPICKAYYD